jgi:uncharacterized protein
VPALVTGDRPLDQWIERPGSQGVAFHTVGAGQPRDVPLVPFHRLHDRRYTVYFDTFTSEDWERRRDLIIDEERREQALLARTIDVLRIGEMQDERDHNVQGEQTEAGDAAGRKWRHAFDGGWFSFEMKVPTGLPAELHCTFWGNEVGRTFDILVDGTVIATQTLHHNRGNQFFEVAYAIPAELTAGKQQVTIRFQAYPGNFAGGLFGARLLRAE